MRHILISKVVCGGFENVFFGVGLRLMSKKMFSSMTCDRTSQVKELVLQHEVIETMAQGSRRPVCTAWMNSVVIILATTSKWRVSVLPQPKLLFAS